MPESTRQDCALTPAAGFLQRVGCTVSIRSMFQLGDKYTRSMGMQYLDGNGELKYPVKVPLEGAAQEIVLIKQMKETIESC